jgi:hypothetical protein
VILCAKTAQLEMLSGTLYRVGLVRTDVSENVSSPSSEYPKLIVFRSCITVERSRKLRLTAVGDPPR